MGDRYMGAKKQINIYKFYRACCDKRSVPGKLAVTKYKEGMGRFIRTAHAVYLDGYAYGMFTVGDDKLFMRYRMSKGLDNCSFYPDDPTIDPILSVDFMEVSF